MNGISKVCNRLTQITVMTELQFLCKLLHSIEECIQIYAALPLLKELVQHGHFSVPHELFCSCDEIKKRIQRFYFLYLLFLIIGIENFSNLDTFILK